MPKGQEVKQITVFGGSGATGRVLIRHALHRGMHVRTLVRDPDALGNSLNGAVIVKGTPVSPDDVSASLKGSCAVICVLGPRPPYADIFCEQATKVIVASMKKNNIKRLVSQTGGMIGDYPDNRSFFFRMMISLFRKRLPKIWLDRVGQESQVIDSGLSWTIVKPPKLVNRALTGKVVAGTGVKLGLLSSITREDLSEFLINEALAGLYTQKAVFVKNKSRLHL